MSAVCPFSRKVFIPDGRIERICGDALRSANLLPDKPSAIRIDRFIEKYFGIEIEYDDLSARFGEGVMGACRFKRDGSVAQILVEQTLAEEDSKLAEKVVRSTMAHEAGHGLLHGDLFAEKFQADAEIESSGIVGRQKREGLLPDGFACRGLGGSAQAANRYDWWEVQANRAMAALLLPKSLVSQFLDSIMFPLQSVGGRTIIPDFKDVRSMVADRFEVSLTMAGFRIEAEYQSRREQPSLL